jgi:hypothetical protein
MEIDMKNAETADAERLGICVEGETVYHIWHDNRFMQEDADFADWCERVGATYTTTKQNCVS